MVALNYLQWLGYGFVTRKIPLPRLSVLEIFRTFLLAGRVGSEPSKNTQTFELKTKPSNGL